MSSRLGNDPFEKNFMLAIPAFSRATAVSRSPRPSSIGSQKIRVPDTLTY
jgi:hypothetical protein